MFKHMHLLGWDCWYLQHHCDCFTSWGPCRAKVDWEFSLVEICHGQTSIRSARDDPWYYDMIWSLMTLSPFFYAYVCTLVESWPMKTPTILCLCFVLRTLKVWVSVENWCVLLTNGQMTLSLTCGWRLRAPETWRSTNALATRPWNSSPWNAKTIRKFMMKNLAWWGWQGHPPNEQNVGKHGRFLPGMALFCVQQTTTKIPWDTFRVTIDLGGTWGFRGSFIFGLAFFGGFFFW